MLISGAIILGCLHSLREELKEKKEKKIRQLSTHLTEGGKVDLERPAHPLKQLLVSMKQETRTKQLKQFGSLEISEKEKSANRNRLAYSGLLGVSVVGSFLLPPLLVIVLPLAAILSFPLIKESYQALSQRKKVVLEINDTIAYLGSFALGYYIISSIDGILYYTNRKLLLKSEDQTIQKMVGIMDDLPANVWLVEGDVEIEIPLEQLKPGDVISLNAGQSIPIDGLIAKGIALIDERSLTGESQAVEKTIGDTCLASTLILEGKILIQVEKVGKETVAHQVEQTLLNTLDYRNESVSQGQRLADQTTLPSLALGIISYPFVGFNGSIGILTSGPGYNLRMVSPIIMLNYLSIASQEGILIKDGRVLEEISQIDTVIFDKTGTLTLNELQLKQIHCLNQLTETQILIYAAAAEYRQSHPIAKSILEEAKKLQLELPSVEHAKVELGFGLQVDIGNRLIHIGSLRYMEMKGIPVSAETKDFIKELLSKGNTFVFIAIGQQLEGILELSPTIRPEAKAVINALKAKKIECCIISGDHFLPTEQLALELGITNFHAEVLPEDKAEFVRGFQKQKRKVCFIGDGINDSIALKQADMSISLNGATAIATDIAQVILINESLSQIPFLFELGEQYKETMGRNLMASISISAITVLSVFVLKFGILAGIIANQINTIQGINKAMQPLDWYREAKKRKQSPTNRTMLSEAKKQEQLGINRPILKEERSTSFSSADKKIVPELITF